MDFHRKFNSFITSVTQAQGCQHITLSGDANTGSTPLLGFFADLHPKVIFHALDAHVFRIILDLLHNGIYFLQLKINDVIHDFLGVLHMFFKQIPVEGSFFGKRIFYIRIKIDGQQTTGVVRAKRYFPTGVRRYGFIAQIGITVRQGLPDNRVPKEDARLSGFPGVMDDFFPNPLRIYLLFVLGIVTLDGILLLVNFVGFHRPHKFIVNPYRHVCAGHFPLGHLSIDETLRIWMLDRNRKHQGSATAILCHFTGGVGVPFHKRHQTGRGQSGIFNGRTFWPYV